MSFDPEAVRAFEHAGWQEAAAEYEATFAKATAPFVEALLDGALKVQPDRGPYYWIGSHEVSARVRIEGPGIAEADQIPRSLLLTGAEVRAKIRCGNHRMGYSLFYGVWEFLYEKKFLWF